MYEYNGTVERVVDGDTVILLVDLGFYVHSEVKVRLLDVFAPELKKRKADKDGSGEAAKAELERLLPVGADVLLVSKSVDKYGRSLASVYRAGDDLRVNYQMAEYLQKEAQNVD